MSFHIYPDTLAKIRSISKNAKSAENFFDRFVSSIGGIKMDSALTLRGATAGGADYLLLNGIIAELKILGKDVWDKYNQQMDDLFARYRRSGELRADIVQEKSSIADPDIPDPMRAEWYSILLKPIDKKFFDADRQIAEAKKTALNAKGVLLLLNLQNRLHAETLRVYWLVQDKILNGMRYPNIEAWIYFCLPVPELMLAGVNQSMFWSHLTRAENQTPDGWTDQKLLMKCRGLEGQWLGFLEKEFKFSIRNIPSSQILWPRP
jgi:hypothetical protein